MFGFSSEEGIRPPVSDGTSVVLVLSMHPALPQPIKPNRPTSWRNGEKLETTTLTDFLSVGYLIGVFSEYRHVFCEVNLRLIFAFYCDIS